ncbi:MAG: hypothetical protein WA738_15960 [Candidatus Angelobacter sp.]
MTAAWCCATRVTCAVTSVTSLLHSGVLRGYRITPKGWWRVIEKSVFEHEENLRKEYGSEHEIGGK